MRRWTFLGALALALGVLVGVAAASTPGADVKLTHDATDPGYVSNGDALHGRDARRMLALARTPERARSSSGPEEHEGDPGLFE